MSELKVIDLGDIRRSIENNESVYYEYYPKSEADKVIAELKRQIEFLKVTTDSCKNCTQCADGMGKVFDKEFNPLKDKLRREKYKRCLAMAKLCHWKMGVFIYKEEKSNFYQRWHKRWSMLAEKFKPN